LVKTTLEMQPTRGVNDVRRLIIRYKISWNYKDIARWAV